MTTAIHHAAPQDIMALLDGELSAEESRALTTHISECAACAAVRAEFQQVAQSLAAWIVPPPTEELNRTVEARIVETSARRRASRPRRNTAITLRNWRLWAIGGGGAAFGALALVAVVAIVLYSSESFRRSDVFSVADSLPDNETAPAPAPPSARQAAAFSIAASSATGAQSAGVPPRAPSEMINGPLKGKGVIGAVVAGNAVSASGPMIARTIGLTILVKNIPSARASLDAILAQHHGYAAQLTLTTPEDGARSFQSSLRIPAPELAPALDALRSLGRVQGESQSGEEVTQQHTDLVARLTNARETESRLRAILEQRSGKMQDVLDVEEKISETRGEIEQMEAEQKALEHRVDFATVDLQLTEVYKAQLSGATPTAGTQMRNSFVSGLRNAGGSLLALVLFLEEFGPSLLLWLFILGLPLWLVWRRYRRLRNPAD